MIPPRIYYSPENMGETMRLAVPVEVEPRRATGKAVLTLNPSIEYKYRLVMYETHHQWERGRQAPCWTYQLVGKV